MIILYGIANCSTVKKAAKFLSNHNLEVTINDHKKNPVTDEWLEKAYKEFGENILNKKSTTWRSINENEKQNLDKNNLFHLLKKYPSVIKRPIILQDGIAILGYNEDAYKKLIQ